MDDKEVGGAPVVGDLAERAGRRLVADLTSCQLIAFDLARRAGEPAIGRWLEENCPDFRAVVAEERARLGVPGRAGERA